MAVDYAHLEAVATRLITENGRDFSLVPPPGPTDAAVPWGSRAAPVPIVVRGVFLDLQRSDDAEPTSVERRVMHVLLDTSVTLPAEVGAGWSLLDGAARFELVRSLPVKPGPLLLYYDLMVRA